MKTTLVFLLFIFSRVFGYGQIETSEFLKTNVDQQPYNYGGKEELKRIIDYHMIYPKNDLKKNIEGTVVIKFICDEKGNIEFAQLTNNISAEIDEEAKRIFKLLQWMPAIKDQKTVKYESVISIPFNIAKYKKSLHLRTKTNCNPKKLPIDSSLTIETKVDQQASYIKSEEVLTQFILSELEYPEEARKNGISGTVQLSFVVETNGFISNLRVTRSVGGGCQEEAIRVIGQTKWKPAQKNGKLVRSVMSYSVAFNLNTDFKDNSQGSQRVGGY